MRDLTLEPGDYVTLGVADTGMGIPEAIQSQVFDPFFTTKAPGRGTGLGLSTLHGILARGGGAIDFETAEGVGTSFIAYLPDADGARSSHAPATRSAERPARTATILLVEDDELMRNLMTEVLEEEGHVVFAADGPASALERLQGAASPIELMITDVVMPGGSGFELAREIEARGHAIPVIYMSGYTDQILADQGELASGDAFLRKPFGNDDLLAKVVDTLYRAAAE